MHLDAAWRWTEDCFADGTCLHHGTVGVLDPGQVYNHPAAWASPWRWAAIHGIFVLGASVVSCIAWRLNELASAEAAASAQRFGNLVQNLDAVVWEADPDMERFTFMSRQAEPVFGIPARAGRKSAASGSASSIRRTASARSPPTTPASRGTAENQFAYRIVADGGRVVHVSDVVHVERDEVGYACSSAASASIRPAGARWRNSCASHRSWRRSAVGGRRRARLQQSSVRDHRTHGAAPRAPPSAGHTARLISSTAQKAAALTRQLLAFGRQQVLEPRVLDLGDVVRRSPRCFGGWCVKTSSCSSRSAGAGHVEADPVQMEQVVLNLIVNASDAMPGGGRLTVEVDEIELTGGWPPARRALRLAVTVTLRVADTGIGMTDDDGAYLRAVLHDQGRRKGPASASRRSNGMRDAERRDIRVESTPGRGTSFTVYLPRVEAPVARTSRTGARRRRHRQRDHHARGRRAGRARLDARRARRLRLPCALRGQASEDALRLAAGTKDPIDLLITDVVCRA